MSPETYGRLFDYTRAFDEPPTVWMTAGIAVALAVAPLAILGLSAAGGLTPGLRRELFLRYYSWLVITPLLLGAVLLGAFWWMLAVCVLSLACYREYARATGLFRERLVSALVALGVVVVTVAVVDHWYAFFVAVFPMSVAVLAAAPILEDRPKGYIQRVALGVLAFSLFGSAFGHLGFLANDRHYRPVVLLILLAVELNDVFAFVCGKWFGRRPLAPNTSPKKTLGGALGAAVLTTTLVTLLGRQVFAGTPVGGWGPLIAMGLLISVGGQLGDLMMSSVKRDLGIKDMATLIPGHGGLLDRFDSLILVAPAVFHLIYYYQGVGLDQPARIFTGGW